MHTIKDVVSIAGQFAAVGHRIETDKSPESLKRAEKEAVELQRQLKSLKLNREDRFNLSLMNDAVKACVKGIRDEMNGKNRGNYGKAAILSAQYANYLKAVHFDERG